MKGIEYDVNAEPIILTKYTMDRFLQEDKPADLIALYSFYYYTAKWQGTNKAKATGGYVAKGLHWSKARVQKNKNKLLEIKLIENIKRRDNKNKITGWYIKINFMFHEKTTSTQKPEGAKC